MESSSWIILIKSFMTASSASSRLQYWSPNGVTAIFCAGQPGAIVDDPDPTSRKADPSPEPRKSSSNSSRFVLANTPRPGMAQHNSVVSATRMAAQRCPRHMAAVVASASGAVVTRILLGFRAPGEPGRKEGCSPPSGQAPVVRRCRDGILVHTQRWARAKA